MPTGTTSPGTFFYYPYQLSAVVNLRDLFVDKFFNFTPIRTRVTRILDYADQYDASFTFFVTAEHITNNNDGILDEIVDRGHEIGSHSFAHVDFEHIEQEAAKKQIDRSLDILNTYYDVEGFRAPYLMANDATLRAAREIGLRYTSSNRGNTLKRHGDIWSLPVTRPMDAVVLHNNEYSLSEVRQLWIDYVGPGEILLFHPWRLGADRFVDVLDEMLAASCEFVTMSEYVDNREGCCITFDFDFLQQRQVYEHTFRHLYRSPHIKQSVNQYFSLLQSS